MREKTFETRIKKFIEAHGGWTVKFFANGYTKSGIPDLLCCIGGHFVAIEVKAEEGKPSPLQLYNQRLIRNSGGICLIVYPSQWLELKNYLDSLMNGGTGDVISRQYFFDKDGQ